MALTKRAWEVWKEISGIFRNETPNLDGSERVGLLTVISGIRPAAVFLDVADAEAKKLVHLLRQIDLIAFVGKGPEPVCAWESPHHKR